MVSFSVIVPVYNCEDYLNDCLQSIIKQDYFNYELILVDDGSTDNSLSICEHYRKQYQNVVVKSKKNEGLLLTRRFALRLVKNEWIIFVDADDYLDKGYFSSVAREIEKNPNIDMVLIKSKTVSDDKRILCEDKPYFEPGRIFNTDKDKEDIFFKLASTFDINAMWKKIAKKSIYDIDTDYSRYGKVKGEDLLQSVPLLNNSSTILYLDMSFYCYRLSSNGLGRNIKVKYLDDFFVVYSTLANYISEHYSNNNKMIDAFVRHYLRYVALLMRSFPSFIPINEFVEASKRVINNDIYLRKKTNKIKIAAQDNMFLFSVLHFPKLSYYLIKFLKSITKCFKK